MGNSSTSKRWDLSTGLAFWGVTVQTVFTLTGLFFILYVVYNLTDIVLSGFLPSVASMSLDYYEDRMMGFMVIVVGCVIISFLGYLVYLAGICLFKGAQRSVDSEVRTRNIMTVELLMPILAILYIVIQVNCYQTIFSNATAIIGYYVLPFIVMLVAVIMLMIQYGSLSKEDTWTEKARGGAGDVKTSYACLLWMLVVVIIGIGMVALTIFSYYSKLDSLRYSGDGYGGMFDGINTVSKIVNDLMHTVKTEILITELFIFALSVWSTIKRIVGWRMIQTGGNEEVYILTQKQGVSSGGGRFCHKCGAALPEGSAFCPGCGTPVAVVAEVETQEATGVVESEDAPQPEPLSSGITIEYEDEEADRKKKWMLWGGVAAGVIVVAAAIWAICGSADKIEPNGNVFAEHSVIFKSIEDGVGVEALADVEYGTEVESKASEFDDAGIWTKVAFKKDGKVTTGYIAKANLLNSEDFRVLQRSGLSDHDARLGLPYNIERLAVLDASKSSGNDWQTEVVTIYGQRQPNSKRLTVRGVNPSEDCLGFILHNKETNERKFFLYSTPDIYSPDNMRDPVYLYSETVKGGDVIYDVNYYKKPKKFEVIYVSNEDSDDSEDFLYEGSAIGEDDSEEMENVWWGRIELNGHVDGKYPVRMEFTMHDGGSVSGTVTYLKYNVPMELSGSFTDSGDSRDLSLDEKSDGKLTGNFIGRYDGKVFSGSWVSADGAKEMPFIVER